MKFVEKPNLPTSYVTMVAMSGVNGIFYKKMQAMGINVIKTYPIPNLLLAESHHADIQLHHLGNNKIIVAKNSSIDLKNMGFSLRLSNKNLEKKYPLNIPLNCARIGDKLICNYKNTDKQIIEYCEQENIHIIGVKQGYSKCSIAVIDEHSIITSDESIYKSSKTHNIDVLKIRPGYIELPGLNYGFIGGTCGKIDKDKIAFCGNLSRHPDFKEIESFINKRGINIVPLKNGSLIDIGGIIPLAQID